MLGLKGQGEPGRGCLVGVGGGTQPPPELWLAVGRVVREETLIFSVLLPSAEASLKPEGKELRGWCSDLLFKKKIFEIGRAHV